MRGASGVLTTLFPDLGYTGVFIFTGLYLYSRLTVNLKLNWQYLFSLELLSSHFPHSEAAKIFKNTNV